MTSETQDPIFEIREGKVILPYEIDTDVPKRRIEAPAQMPVLLNLRELARAAFTLDSPVYADLGGGIEEAEFQAGDVSYGKFLDNFEPWKTEVATAFEQFSFPALEPSILTKMTQQDKTLLAHYFTQYVDHLWGRSGYLMAPGSGASEVAAGYGLEDDAAAKSYGEELRELHDVLKQNPVYPILRNVSLADRPIYKRAAYVERYSTQHGQPALVFDKQSHKYRFQTVADEAANS